MLPEIWKMVAGSSCYQVSNLGNVRRVRGERCRETRPLTPRLRKGYLAAHLSEGNRQRNGPIHILVCEAFHGPRPSAEFVAAHCDGNPLNNRADNLRWATISENVMDRHSHGNPPSGEGNPNAKLSCADALEILYSEEGAAELAKRFGVSRNQVWRIRKGLCWTTLREEAERLAA